MAGKNNKIIDTRTLFNRETAVIDESRRVLQDHNLDKQDLEPHFRALLFEYENLLKVAVRITRISDEYQMQFLLANEKIKEQKSELERTNREQVRLLRELEESNATKDKFFSIVSHDLKSAFGSLKMGFEMLSVDTDRLGKEKIKELSTHLRKTWQNMFDLLENLLQWSKIQMGRMSHQPENVDLSNLLERVTDVLSGTIEEKNVRIVSRISFGAAVYADENMLRSILQNVLSNAVKFSYPGDRISIECKQKADTVEISVRDHGIGIKNKALKTLFRIDQQYTTLGTSQEKGTGLGLILSKEFVKKNHGDIWIESTPGSGTTVFISLPAPVL